MAWCRAVRHHVYLATASFHRHLHVPRPGIPTSGYPDRCQRARVEWRCSTDLLLDGCLSTHQLFTRAALESRAMSTSDAPRCSVSALSLARSKDLRRIIETVGLEGLHLLPGLFDASLRRHCRRRVLQHDLRVNAVPPRYIPTSPLFIKKLVSRVSDRFTRDIRRHLNGDKITVFSVRRRGEGHIVLQNRIARGDNRFLTGPL